MRKIFVFAFLFGVISVALLSCSGKKKKAFAQNTVVYDTSLPSNQAMAKYLADCVTQYFDKPGNRYASSTQAEALLHKKTPEKTEDFITWKKNIGDQWLFAGQTQKAIDQYDEAMQRAQKDGYAGPLTKEIRYMLAVAYMRLGEQQNCITNHNAASCILPIAEPAWYVVKTPTERSVELWEEILQDDPDDLSAKFLLNVAYMNLGKYPDAMPAEYRIDPAKFNKQAPIPHFDNIASALGLDFFTRSGGVCTEDFNNDGLLDIATTGWFLDEQLRIYFNKGDGTFYDMTDSAGIQGITGGLDMKTADYDNDGYTDILIPRGAWWNDYGKLPCSLLHNNGDGTFTDVTYASGLMEHMAPTQAAVFADFNNDGLLDIFFGNESRKGTEKYFCELFIHQANGTFVNEAKTAGVDLLCFPKGAVAGDYDNDGWMDISISSQGTRNYLLHNETGKNKGTLLFRDVTKEAGIEGPIKSFPLAFFDYNNDGWQDLAILTYDADKSDYDNAAYYFDKPVKGEYSILYKNNGNGTFTDVSKELHFRVPMAAMAFNYGDLDNDGYLDLYVGTGTPNYTSLVPNRMLYNDKGNGFIDVTEAGGFGNLQKGHGIGFGDMDNDGDQDIYEDMGGGYEGDAYPSAFYENPGNANHWVTLKLNGTTSNRSAIGAKVAVTVVDGTGAETTFYHVLCNGGSFGANSLQLEMGLGRAASIKQIEITWPASNAKQILTQVPMDTFIVCTEGTAGFIVETRQKFTLVREGGHSAAMEMMGHDM
ncbi:MAG: CRTAC1 family protein [Chitinophagales bacterium]